MRPSYRPHYASCYASVCPSVCLSVPYGLATGKQKRTKTKIGVDVPQITSKWDANFQMKMSKGQGHWTSKTSAIWRHVYAIVRPNLMSAPETLGNWTDSRISCRHSMASCFLVYFVFSFLPSSSTH